MKATLSLRVTLASLAAFIVVPVITVAEREAAGGARASSGEPDRGSFYVANRAPWRRLPSSNCPSAASGRRDGSGANSNLKPME